MAWQLAAHWGNRRFARPAPRAEVVSAALLAGWGWVEEEPESDPGRLASAPPRPGLAHWRSTVGRAADFSCYAALLLATRFAERAEDACGDSAATGSFREEMARRAADWREALAADARYEGTLSGPGFAVNLALLAAWEDVVEALVASGPTPFAVRVPARDGSPVEVALAPIGDGRWRVRPWPLQGERLQLHCEGRRGGGEVGSAVAPAERVTFNLLRPAARG